MIQDIKFRNNETIFTISELPNASIAQQLVMIVYEDKLPPLSQVKRVTKIILKIIGLLPCYGSTAPHFYVAISLGGVRAVLVTGSVVINFGTLTYWGFICLINKLIDAPLVTRKEDIHYLASVKKLALFTLSVFWGMGTRLTPLGILFNMERAERGLSPAEITIAALLSVVFRSTTTSYSIYESLGYFEKFIKNRFFLDKYEKILEAIQTNLSIALSIVTNKTIGLDREERKRKFSTFYDSKNKDKLLIPNKEVFNSLFYQVLTFSKEKKNEQSMISGLMQVPKKIVEYTFSVIPGTALLVQNGLLTHDALANLSKETTVFNVAYATFSAFSFCWVAYNYCSLSAGTLFKKTFRYGSEKTFGEECFPITVFILDLLSVVMAGLTHDEITKVAQFYVNSKKWWGLLFMEANFIASFLLIVNAMQDFYEAGLHNMSKTACADPRVQEVQLLLSKLKNFKEIIVLCYLPQILELLKIMDETNLQMVLEESKISVNALKEVFEQYSKK